MSLIQREKMYTYKQAASILGYTYEHICRLVNAGKFGRKFPTGYEITQADIDKFKRTKPGPRPGLPSGKILRKMMRDGMTSTELSIKYKVTKDAVFKRIARARK